MAETNAVALKLPPFYKSNPAMWFHQKETQFTIKNSTITDDNTKFAYLLSALPDDIAELMEFAVENTPEDDKYSSLKAALIKQFGLIKAQKAKKLASFTTLDPSMTPTMLLMHLLSSDSTSEEFLHQFKLSCHLQSEPRLAGSLRTLRHMQRLLTTWLRPPRSVPMDTWLGVHPRWIPLVCASITHGLVIRHLSAGPHASSK